MSETNINNQSEIDEDLKKAMPFLNWGAWKQPQQQPADELSGKSKPKGVTFVEGAILAELDKLLQEREMDIMDPPPEQVYLLKDLRGVNTLPIENLMGVIAPRKSGKSAFGSILMASVLGCGEKFNLYKATPKVTKVLYIDTEQSKPDQFQVVNYLKEFCKEKHLEGEQLKKRFSTIHGKGIEAGRLRQVTERKIQLFKPDFIYIDGVKEYVNDINDPKECTEVIRQFEAMSEVYHCAILLVIHTNKLKKEDLEDLTKYTTRGHLGSELENKASDCFSCVKKKDGNDYYFEVVHNISRHEEIMDIVFQRDRNQKGLPIPYRIKIAFGKVEDKANTFINAIIDVFRNSGSKVMSKGKLDEALRKSLGKSDTTIRNLFEKYKDEVAKVLRVEEKSKGKDCSLIEPNQPAEPALPFERPDDNEAEPF